MTKEEINKGWPNTHKRYVVMSTSLVNLFHILERLGIKSSTHEMLFGNSDKWIKFVNNRVKA